MHRFQSLLLLLLFVFLSACSVNSSSVSSPQTPVKPAKLPTVNDLVGKYRLFAGSEVNFDVVEENGQLFMSLFGQREALQKISPTRFKMQDGQLITFESSPSGQYDRFVTLNEGRPRLFIRDESLQRERSQVSNQSAYTAQVMKSAKAGAYAYSRFVSPSRGLVDYAVYLPPQWRRNSNKSYPLMFFLHGQLGWERSFPDSVPAQQLNEWIGNGRIPPMVIVSLRTGRLNGNQEEQWTTPRQETLLTSEASNELRAFIRKQFRAGLSAKTTAIQGHSRGSRGAIHYALKFPNSFSSSVANAFVSDYALPELKRIAQQNQQQIRNSGIPLRISIGDRDEFALNMGRRGSAVIHQYLNKLNIPHDYEVFRGINHGFVNVWNTKMRNGITNGLAELQLHAEAWAKR